MNQMAEETANPRLNEDEQLIKEESEALVALRGTIPDSEFRQKLRELLGDTARFGAKTVDSKVDVVPIRNKIIALTRGNQQG